MMLVNTCLDLAVLNMVQLLPAKCLFKFPGHSGLRGNEEGDRWAREGT